MTPGTSETAQAAGTPEPTAAAEELRTAEAAETDADTPDFPGDDGGVTAKLPLDDIRVIDLTVARAGPTCVRQLADWGADVIRVEPPPAEPGAPGLVGTRHGADFQNLHRNKRSLSL